MSNNRVMSPHTPPSADGNDKEPYSFVPCKETFYSSSALPTNYGEASSRWHLKQNSISASSCKLGALNVHRAWLKQQHCALIEHATADICTQAAVDARRNRFSNRMRRIRKRACKPVWAFTEEEDELKLLDFVEGLDYETKMNEFENILSQESQLLAKTENDAHPISQLMETPQDRANLSIAIMPTPHVYSPVPHSVLTSITFTSSSENISYWYSHVPVFPTMTVIPEYPSLLFEASRLPYLRQCPSV